MAANEEAGDTVARQFRKVLAEQGLGGARFVVAYSGGPDSTLLLAVAAECLPRRRLRTVHVDHGWHAAATDWAEHCRESATGLGLRCAIRRVDSRPRQGEGPEAAARAARYRALQAELAAGDVLLTGHHADDQAETVLFALLRGGGSRGLAGMPICKRLPPGWHLRPFLEVDRAEIERGLAARGLPALDDPANHDGNYDRVFLRERVLPLLRERWPAIDAGLVRSARLAAEAVEVEAHAAATDYRDCRGGRPHTLDCRALCALPAARQRALLRWWIRREGLPAIPSARLASALAQFAEAAAGRVPRIAWPGGELRRWDGLIWLRPPRPAPRPGERFFWRVTAEPLALPEGPLPPAALAPLGSGSVPEGPLILVRRQGGERLQRHGGGRPRRVTELLREAGLPPWQRDEALLVWSGSVCLGVLAPGLAFAGE